ncbi:hypothetical protein CYLTODRAFT_460202 [Cylindrobasidium torrendii FP15055 ss-10]|uniref:Uncharacterized protein n=1 Tax=Cylindrobasidium torrendii FP15055 ss-10 TaxID=1314674 RepID=A0A0D7ARN9_9AGAR|nr:hypothetical protein CYLTODRAFT_460202 [Cylindrobasidium torrendii FP15055 ss-10]
MVVPSAFTQDNLARLDNAVMQQDASTLQVVAGWSEKDYYNVLAKFLNSCVAHARKAIKDTQLIGDAESLFTKLTFFPWDRQMKDGIKRAHPLKPDLVGVNFVPAKADTEKPLPECHWSPPDSESPKLEFPVEVKDRVSEIVTQASTYARGLFMAIPLCSYSLVLGFNTAYRPPNHNTAVGALRFLLFHHGGLTASDDLDMTSGRYDVVKTMARIMLQRTLSDAGIPSFTNGIEIRLPKSVSHPEDSVYLFVQKIFYHALSLRGHNTFVARVGPTPPVDPRSLNQCNKTPTSAKRLKQEKALTSQATCTEPMTALVVPRRFFDSEAEYVPPQDITFAPNFVGLNDDHNLIVKCTWSSKGRADVEPAMYQACAGEFGCPSFAYSFAARFADGRAVTNKIYLPEEANIDQRYWHIGRIANESRPTFAEERSLQVSVLLEEGHSLEQCEDAADLAISVGHALLGYLNALLKGWMHRDISIGNILRLVNEVDRKPFQATSVIELLRENTRDGSAEETADKSEAITWEYIDSLPSGDSQTEELVANAKSIGLSLDTLNISDKCRAVWSDGDMAANMDGYFERPRNKSEISGTIEFMSTKLRKCMNKDEPYIHTPLDDLYSFLYTMLWATLNNKGRLPDEKAEIGDELRWRQRLRSTDEFTRDGVVRDYMIEFLKVGKYSPMVRSLQPFFAAWVPKLDQLYQEGRSAEDTLSSDEDADIVARGQAVFDMYKHLAFCGVAEYFELVIKYRESLGIPGAPEEL